MPNSESALVHANLLQHRWDLSKRRTSGFTSFFCLVTISHRPPASAFGHRPSSITFQVTVLCLGLHHPVTLASFGDGFQHQPGSAFGVGLRTMASIRKLSSSISCGCDRPWHQTQRCLCPRPVIWPSDHPHWPLSVIWRGDCHWLRPPAILPRPRLDPALGSANRPRWYYSATSP